MHNFERIRKDEFCGTGQVDDVGSQVVLCAVFAGLEAGRKVIGTFVFENAINLDDFAGLV
jgi:hypothetical protein